jgi:hypothetical protein
LAVVKSHKNWPEKRAEGRAESPAENWPNQGLIHRPWQADGTLSAIGLPQKKPAGRAFLHSATTIPERNKYSGMRLRIIIIRVIK